VSAGAEATACYSSLLRTFQGDLVSEYDGVFGDAQGHVTVLDPYDWDDDGDIDGDDLVAWRQGTSCRVLPQGVWTSTIEVGPSEFDIADLVSVERNDEDHIGAPLSSVTAVVSDYGSVRDIYQAGASIPGASIAWNGAGSFTALVPPDHYDFKVTNPATVEVVLTADGDGGGCYQQTVLWTVAAYPSVSAFMWIDGTGYLGLGGVVAPRPGSAAYFGRDTIFGADAEVDEGIYELDQRQEPEPTSMRLLYFSAGNRFATGLNESLLSTFSIQPTTPQVLTSVNGPEVHFLEPADLNEDSQITPADLRWYLDELQ
ncbi:MAG: hypothetical protein ACJATT_005380, partial [Myxococcota bacterium]